MCVQARGQETRQHNFTASSLCMVVKECSMTFNVSNMRSLYIGIKVTVVHLPYCDRIRHRKSCMTFIVSGLVAIKLHRANESDKLYFN